MPDQRYPNGSSPRNNPRSYRSYEERYTYSTREGSSSQRSRSVASDARRVSRDASHEYAQANNPRHNGRVSREESRAARGSDRVMVDRRSSYSAGNPRVRRDARNAEESVETVEPRPVRSRAPRTDASRPSTRASVDGMKPMGGGAGRYDGANYSAQRGRSRGGNRGGNPISKVLVIMVVVALFGAGFGIYNIVNPAQFEVSINGMTKTLERGTTIDDVIAEGVVSPVAGDFIAVDNSIITEGGGDRFSAVLNEKEVIDGTIKLHKDDVIQVSDGKDVMEEYSVSEVTTEPGQSVAGIGSIHHYVEGIQGVTEVRTGATSGLTVETVITPVSDAMYKSYNADVGADKVIALTFDDGPWPETTDQVLDILAQYGAKATFFTIGCQIDDYPEATKRIVDEGHQLCTHTWDHAEGSGQGVNLTYMSAEEQIAEITKGYDAIKSITGQEASRIIRAPGGNYSGDIVWTLKPYVDAEIGWNVDTQDWARPGADAIAQAIMSSEPGDVVLMHDGGGDRSQTVAALKIALPKLIERGYKFVTMDELIAYNDPASMEPGTWN